MAQTPAERRERRNAYARTLTDPRTGQPFKNYNALDTWQRNQKAQSQGFKSRAQKRYRKETQTLVSTARAQFPGAYEAFLKRTGLKSGQRAAKDFLLAFGPYPGNVSDDYKDRSHAMRAAYVARMKTWDWRLWAEEYSMI